MSVTIVIIVITVLISIFAFRSQKVLDDLIFYPAAITEKNQYYRFVTYGFIHADLSHLFFNMYALYGFGRFLESFAAQMHAKSSFMQQAENEIRQAASGKACVE